MHNRSERLFRNSGFYFYEEWILSNMVFDRNENPVPRMQVFSYIQVDTKELGEIIFSGHWRITLIIKVDCAWNLLLGRFLLAKKKVRIILKDFHA